MALWASLGIESLKGYYRGLSNYPRVPLRVYKDYYKGYSKDLL